MMLLEVKTKTWSFYFIYFWAHQYLKKKKNHLYLTLRNYFFNKTVSIILQLFLMSSVLQVSFNWTACLLGRVVSFSMIKNRNINIITTLFSPQPITIQIYFCVGTSSSVSPPPSSLFSMAMSSLTLSTTSWVRHTSLTAKVTALLTWHNTGDSGK